jgi:hypothetical protein
MIIFFIFEMTHQTKTFPNGVCISFMMDNREIPYKIMDLELLVTMSNIKSNKRVQLNI